MAFKVWKQSPPLKYSAWFLGAAIIALIVWTCISYSELVIVESITLGALGKWILGLIVTFAVAYLFGWLVRVLKWRQSSSGRTLIFAKNLAGKVVKWRESLYRVAFGVAMSIFGWIIARVHLHVFDRMFLKRGSLDYFRRRD